MDNRNVRLMGIFPDFEGLLRAIRAMKDAGREKDLEALSPIDMPELRALLPQKPSKVRWFTLLGSVFGACGMMAFAIMTVLLWPLVTAGKRIVSIPAFIPITFEIMVLIAGVSTLIGLFLTAKLPGITAEPSYSGASQSDFALIVRHEPSEFEAIEAQLREAGASEVRPYNPVLSPERLSE